MKNKQIKLCKDCLNRLDTKPLPRCNSSKYIDPVDGHEKRACMIERLDGIGRCGSMANNFTPKGSK
jgi:hypothetical protein